MELKYLVFYSSIDLSDVKDVLKENLMLQFSWLENTWRAPVWKLLTQSTLNFAHSFLTDCRTKWCRVFSNNELFIFYCNNSTNLERVFHMKTVKSRLFKKYLKKKENRGPGFVCLWVGYVSMKKKLQKTTILLVQELKK